MAALTAAAFAVTLNRTFVDMRRTGGRKEHEGVLVLTGGTDEYVVGGIPLPAISNFGFIRNMNSLVLYDVNASVNAYLPYYDKDNHTLQLFDSAAAGAPLTEEGANDLDAPTTRTYRFKATGW